MKDDNDRLIYLAGGPLAAILLGVLLIPLRGFTIASNFTFVFVALTVFVAEVGGEKAAVATALCSALSLDFFLTQPYLRLAINDKHDLIAFVGLTVCGLVVATVGARRDAWAEALRAGRRRTELLHSALLQAERAASPDAGLRLVLEACCSALPLAAAAVYDVQGTRVAATEGAHAMPPPAETLHADVLLPPETPTRDLRRRPPLPREGGRLGLVAGGRQVGWLDVWGDGAPASEPDRRTLADVARLMAVVLAGAGPRPAV